MFYKGLGFRGWGSEWVYHGPEIGGLHQVPDDVLHRPKPRLLLRGLGFRVEGSGLRVQGLGLGGVGAWVLEGR